MKHSEYEQKRKEIIEKFTASFIEQKYNTNATLNSTVEYLIRGGNPYEIIEMLINNQENIIEELQKAVENRPFIIQAK